MREEEKRRERESAAATLTADGGDLSRETFQRMREGKKERRTLADSI